MNPRGIAWGCDVRREELERQFDDRLRDRAGPRRGGEQFEHPPMSTAMVHKATYGSMIDAAGGRH